jgi:hypothetical protein
MDHPAAARLSISRFGWLKPARAAYRIRQFWRAWRARPAPADLEHACRLLSPAEYALFLRLQPGEQAHSLHVLAQLEQRGDDDPNLLAAALLHDVGKIRYPLHLWERALIVLAHWLLPRQSRRWGQVPSSMATGWHKAFLVAEHHPAWGAELAAQAGSPERTIALIRRHQQPVDSPDLQGDDLLLTRLQAVDDYS